MTADEESNNAGIIDLFIEGAHSFFPFLKKAIWLILMLIFFKDINLVFDPFISSSLLKAAISYVQMLCVIYVAVVVLYVADAFYKNETINYRRSFLHVLKKLFPVCIVCIVLLLYAIVLAYLATRVVLWLSPDVVHRSVFSQIFLLMFVGLCILYVYLRCFFVIPLIVLDNMPLMAAFKHSFDLVMDNMIRTFSVYFILIFAIIFSSQRTYHAFFLREYHVSFLFDFVFIGILLTFFSCLVILLLKDLKIKHKEAQKYIDLL